jgi:hypothetical protein
MAIPSLSLKGSLNLAIPVFSIDSGNLNGVFKTPLLFYRYFLF